MSRRTGGVAPGKLGGHRKPVLLPEREWLLARIAAEPNVILRGLLGEPADRGVKASFGALWLFLESEGLSFKKMPVRQRAGSPGHCPAAGTVAQIPEPA